MRVVKKLILLIIGIILFSSLISAFTPYPFVSNPLGANRSYAFNSTCVDDLGRQDCTTDGSYVTQSWTKGTGIFLDGANQEVDLNLGVTTDKINIRQGFTIAFRINSTDTTPATYLLASSTASPSYFRINKDGSADEIRVDFNDGTSGLTADFAGWSDLMNGQNHSFVVRITSSAIGGESSNRFEIYIDGVNVTSRVDGDQGTLNDFKLATDITLGANGGAGTQTELVADDLVFWNRTLTVGEIQTWSHGNYSGTGTGAETSSTFQITGTDNYTSTSILNLTAEIFGVGNFSTINGTINTNLLQNETSLFNITVSSNSTGGYFSKTFLNYNVSSNLAVSLYQAVLNLTPLQIFTNTSIPGGSFSIGSYQVSQGSPFYLAAGSYNVTFSHGSYYNKTQEFTLSALDNLSNYLTSVYDAILNVTATNAGTGSSIASFTITALDGSYLAQGSTSNGHVDLGLLKDLIYDLSIDASGYELSNASLLVNETLQNYSFSLFTTNSIRIFIRKESDNTLITGQNISIRLFSNISEQNFQSDNGTLYLDNLNPQEYQVLFNGSGYSVRTYTLTVTNGSSQQLTAYLASGTSTTIFTITDKDDNSVLQNVLATMYRFINGSWMPVESKYTDITGKIQFSYLSDTNYKFFLGKSGYEDYVFYLNPVLFSTYSVAMSKSSTIDYSQDYDRVSIIYAPTFFNYSSLTTFNWIISSPFGELISYGFTLIYPGGSSSTSGFNAIGGQLSASINITNATIFDTVQLNYFYETTTAGVRNFTFYYPIVFPPGGNLTFLSNRDQTYGLGIFERALISTIIVIFVMGVAALVGQPIPGLAISLFVMGYLVKIGFIPLWLILPSMLFGLIILFWKGGG